MFCNVCCRDQKIIYQRKHNINSAFQLYRNIHYYCERLQGGVGALMSWMQKYPYLVSVKYTDFCCKAKAATLMPATSQCQQWSDFSFSSDRMKSNIKKVNKDKILLIGPSTMVIKVCSFEFINSLLQHRNVLSNAVKSCPLTMKFQINLQLSDL